MDKKYLYHFRYTEVDKELFDLEMSCIFDEKIDNTIFFSNEDIKYNKSQFLKEKVEIITYANSMEELLINIDKLNDSEDGFKVVYQEFDNDELPYKKRMEYIIAIAMKLKAVGVINNPKDKYYVWKKEDFFFNEHIIKPLKLFQDKGYLIIIWGNK